VSRPLIGLTVGPENGTSDYIHLRGTYVRAVEGAGGMPVLLPALTHAEAWLPALERLDGLIFPGGLDVAPAEYGETPHPTVEVNPPLDRLELTVARWAARTDVPVLGICRGQQLLNVALGGSLVQHLEHHRQPEPHGALSHRIRVEPDSHLADLLGATDLQVNSHHHQAVARLGDGLRAVAWAPDGVIEGIESTSHPWLVAVQFHPEDLVGFHEPSQRLFAAFVEACSSRRLVGARRFS
jgi:putative glutamine amidotransferase